MRKENEMNELETKYENMTHAQRIEEARKIEHNIASLKKDICRMEGLLHRMNTIDDDISHQSKELGILKQQKVLAAKEARVLCA